MKKIRLIFLCLFVMILSVLAGCGKGDSLSKDKVTYTYHKNIQAVEVKSNFSEDVYGEFDIILLNSKNEILHKEEFNVVLKPGIQHYDLEDIKPEYISYEKVAAMDAEFKAVYEIAWFEYIILLLVLFLMAEKLYNRG